MKIKLIMAVCNMIILGMIVFPQVKVWPASLDVRVSSSQGDAEEGLSDHSVNLGSLNLDMVYSDDEQIVGLCFQNVTVPRSVKITNAYIEFETGEKGNVLTSLNFKGESGDDAMPFHPMAKDISKRSRTNASVQWNDIPPWETIGEKQQTPDLSSIVQEIIDRPGWSGGNAMVFFVTGTGRRAVKSFDGKYKSAPLLHIEYQSCSMDIRVCQAGDDGEELTDGSISLYGGELNIVFNDPEHAAGIRFQNVNVSRGAIITTAYLEFEATDTGAGKAGLIIKGEADDNAPAFNNSMENITDRTITNSTVSWNPIPPWTAIGEKYKTPDLSPIVQEIVGRPGWTTGNAMVFIITGSGRRIISAYDGKSGAGPLLHIECTNKNFPYISVDKNTLRNICLQGNGIISDSFIINNTGSDTLRYVISDDKEWISCSPKTGLLDAGDSVSISLDYCTASLDTGTHDGSVKIVDPAAPNSPLDIDVSIIVQPLDEMGLWGHNPVYTEKFQSPAILILMDLSDSMQTLMPVSGPDKNPCTPDIKGIVQEIVERPGWKRGNSMVFIIEGSGHRKAESYDGESDSAPLLHVKFINAGKPEYMDIRVSHSSDDAEEIHTGDVFLAGTDLDMGNNKGFEQKTGIRFKNIPIPPKAAIINAFIEFVADESQGEPAYLTIRGEALDNPPTFSECLGNISNRTLTNAYVNWDNIPEWIVTIKQSRIDIAKSLISTLVVEKDIAWGYGTWCSRKRNAGYTPDIDYTKIHVGCKPNDPDHLKNLQSSIRETSGCKYARTPFAHSLVAAKKYFLGQKKDKDGTGSTFSNIACQPKFIISITDGLGNMGSTDTLIRQYVGDLCDIGVIPIAVGFGINDATQLQLTAQLSNEIVRPSDDPLVLHDEINGFEHPFLADSKNGLMERLTKITGKIKAQKFYGSAPAPNASSIHGDILVLAEFDATDWTGDLVAYTNDKNPGWDSVAWRASQAIPLIRSAFIVDPSGSERVIPYTDSVLAKDNWLCKDIGDIVHSIPVIIGDPPFYYNFDGYEGWKNSIDRDPMVYVGSNDGSLHAFLLSDGTEQWAFFPKSSHKKLNKANDPEYNQCGNDYCHQYLIDGSPKVGDIYTGNSWMTILICGLREGGESYFALDVTYGRPFGGERGTGYLWEFTDPQLGQTWSEPAIERIKNGTGTDWGVFFGSGYATADQTNKEAYLYGIVAYTREPLWNNGYDNINRIKISSATLGDDALSSPLVADLNADYKGDRIYVGNLYGTMYRIVNIGKGECPGITKLFDFGHTSHINPIRAKAAYAYAVDRGSIWLYFGTGRYETQKDKVSGTQQYFFGLKETIDTFPAYSLDNLKRLETKKIDYRDPKTHETQQVKIIYGKNNTKGSWALLLEGPLTGLTGSERVIDQPLVIAGMVFFSTFVPDQDICRGNGDTWLYALEYETGMPPVIPVFDLNKDKIFDDGDRVMDENGIKHNIGAIHVGAGPGSKPVFYKDRLFITTINNNVVAVKVNLPKSMTTVTSWKDCTI